MKKPFLSKLLIFALVVVLFENSGLRAAGESNPSPKPEARFKLVPFGSIRPEGWIRKMIEQDVTQGLFVNYYRTWELKYNAYVNRELVGSEARPWRGVAGHAWEGAVQAGWGLALITNAILSGDSTATQRADEFVAMILKSQDPDGYIGIFNPSNRYQPDKMDLNGSRGLLFQGLLYYAQGFARKDVLDAVERAVQCDMRHFNRDSMNLWARSQLAMNYPQFLDQLAQATGKAEYAEYGAFVIESYSSAGGLPPTCFADGTLANLLDLERPFVGHAANTTPYLVLPWLNYYVTGNPVYRQAAKNGFAKFFKQMSLSGSLPGDEDNNGRAPFPDIGIEFCTTTYLMESAAVSGEKTGESRFFDLAERVFFNAGMGARMWDGTSHAYLKRDSELSLDYGPDPASKIMHRYQYSPAHEPFCCAEAMMDLLPLFTSHMFKQTKDGRSLAAVGFGPATVDVTLAGTKVRVEERTQYPFASDIDFHVRPEKSVVFEFLVRVPEWAPTATVACDGAEIGRQRDYYVIKKLWHEGDLVRVRFETPVEAIHWVNDEYALKSGPLVFAAKIEAVPVRYDTFPSGKQTTQELSGGKQPIFGFTPGKNKKDWEGGLIANAKQPAFGFKRVVVQISDPEQPWRESPVQLQGEMSHMRRTAKVALVPMGSTVLRRVTFPASLYYGSSDTATMMDSNTSR